MSDYSEEYVEHLQARIAELEDRWKEFFAILDAVEESSNGNEFHPVYISSCRVHQTAKLREIFDATSYVSHLAEALPGIDEELESTIDQLVESQYSANPASRLIRSV